LLYELSAFAVVCTGNNDAENVAVRYNAEGFGVVIEATSSVNPVARGWDYLPAGDSGEALLTLPYIVVGTTAGVGSLLNPFALLATGLIMRTVLAERLRPTL
jgi:hypothetical protein